MAEQIEKCAKCDEVPYWASELVRPVRLLGGEPEIEQRAVPRLLCKCDRLTGFSVFDVVIAAWNDAARAARGKESKT